MKKSLILTLFAIILLSSVISAKIETTQPLDIYNLGDTIPLTVTLTPDSTTGWFEVKLVCSGTEIIIEKTLGTNFIVGEEQKRNIQVPLTQEYIGELKDTCHILASIGTEQILTEDFKISTDILLNIRLDKENYNPGETITLSVDAIKENGIPLNGFIELSGARTISKAISDGETRESFAMPETSEAKDYELIVRAYDKRGDQILSEKIETIKFNINQIPSSLILSLGSLEVTPGEPFSYSVDLFDQSGVEIDKAVIVSLVSPKGKETQITTTTDAVGEIEFTKNETPGAWRISAQVGELYEEKEFSLKEIQEIEMELAGPILLVKNIGNSRYNKAIDVKIGDETKRLELNIQPGEERKFNLKAPEGEYDISVDSNGKQIQGRAFLTGNVIDVKGGSGSNLLNTYPIIWIFIIILIAALAITFYFKSRTKTHRVSEKYIKKSKNRRLSKKEKDFIPAPTKSSNSKDIDLTEEKKAKGAESSLVMSGEKEHASVVAVKIPELSKLHKAAKEELVKVLALAKEDKGMVERKEDHIIVVFSPLVTKTFKNEALAARTASRLKEALSEYNKIHVHKIPFNIGLNSGEIIASLEGSKLRYTSLGNTIVLAKRIADSDNDKILVSEKFRNQILRDLRVTPAKPISGAKVFEITELRDKEANKEKLQEILKRMKREENK